VALMLGVAAVGLVSRSTGTGAPPPPCPQPALRDGVLVCDGNGAPAGARTWLVGRKLDLNRASVAQIEQVPGVGPSLARAIVDARIARGGFHSYAELDDVPGIGPKTLARLAPFVDVPASP
jgi:competence protein ComEA